MTVVVHRSWWRTPLARSVLTSLFTTVLDYAVLIGLVELFAVNYVVATWLGTVVGSLSNFTINRYWAFDASHVATHRQLLRFVPVQAGSSAWQALGVWLFTRFGGLAYTVSKTIIAMLVYMGWNYPLNRFWVFRR